MRVRGIVIVVLCLALIVSADRSYAWSNGGYSSNPYEVRYGTHDWIAEHALDWLPDEARGWIKEYMGWYLYGTELPDNGRALYGIGDTHLHHIYFYANGSIMDCSAARRANDTYLKALEHLLLGNFMIAAKYAGAMTHYIADMAVFGHVMGRNTVWGEEKHHSDYESYINSKTSTYHSDFEIFLSFDGELRIISAYDAAVELAYDTTFDRLGRGLTCVWMDENYDWSNPVFVGRVGESLNLAVNYVADVLYTLYVDYKSRLHAKYVRVTFAAVGLEEDADGTIIRVDGVDYGYDDLPLTFEWILGSTHTYEWMEYVYSYEYGKRYVTSMRGGNITILEADLAIIAEYRVQYLWILSAEGLGLDAAEPLILGYSYSDLPLEFWWDKGSTHTIVYPEYVYCRPAIEGKRYANHDPPHLNITVESSGSMRPVYHVEYAVYIASVDGGTTDPLPGVYWLDENSTMTVTAIPGEGYVFEKWVGSTEFRDNPLTVVIRSPLRLEPLFAEYFDFSISVKPGEGVARKGENVSTRIDIGLLRGAGNVVLSVVDPPVGISYRLSVKSGSPPLSSTLSIYVGGEAKPGVYDLTILAESRDTRRMAIYRLTILESEENWIQQNQILIASLSISAIIIAIILLSRRMKIWGERRNLR